jgi:hypothetical protein
MKRGVGGFNTKGTKDTKGHEERKTNNRGTETRNRNRLRAQRAIPFHHTAA